MASSARLSAFRPQSRELKWEQIERLRKYTQFFHYQSSEAGEINFRLQSLVNKIVKLLGQETKKYFIGSVARFAIIGGDLPGDCDIQILIRRVDDWRCVSNALIHSISSLLTLDKGQLVQTGLKKRNFLTGKNGETFGVMVTLPCRPLDLDIQIVTRANSLNSQDFRICMDKLEAETVSNSFGTFEEALTLIQKKELRFLTPQKIHEGFRVFCVSVLKGYKTLKEDERKVCLGLFEQDPRPNSDFKVKLESFVSKKFEGDRKNERKYFRTYLQIVHRSKVLSLEYKEKIFVLLGPIIKVKSIEGFERLLKSEEDSAILVEFENVQREKFSSIDEWEAFYERAESVISVKEMVEVLIRSSKIKILPLQIVQRLEDHFHILKIDDHMTLLERLCLQEGAPFDLLSKITLSLHNRASGKKKRERQFLKILSSKPCLNELLRPKAKKSIDRGTSPTHPSAAVEEKEEEERPSPLSQEEVVGPDLEELQTDKSVATISWEAWASEPFNPLLHNYHIFKMMCCNMHRDSDWETVFSKIEKKIASFPNSILGLNSHEDYHNALVITRFRLLLSESVQEDSLKDETVHRLIQLLVEEFALHNMSLGEVLSLWDAGLAPFLNESQKRDLESIETLCKYFTSLFARIKGLKMAINQERDRKVRMKMKLELNRLNKSLLPIQSAIEKYPNIIRLLKRKR